MIGRVRVDRFSPFARVQGNLYVSRSIDQFQLSLFFRVRTTYRILDLI